ncbi:hypothetical protein ZWY2020_010673 [Hordeum vulgare]|nr:hypothetical protein ZWY2020_010673 [Hordeum vulgare]
MVFGIRHEEVFSHHRPTSIHLNLEGRDRRFQVLLPHSKKFSAGRLVGGEKGPDSIPNSALLSALPGNIYLHKVDQEIGRIRQKHEIPLVVQIRSVLLRIGRRIDDQEKYGKEASLNAPQDNRALIVGRVKSIHISDLSFLFRQDTPPQAPLHLGETRKCLRFPLQ